jgi:LPXTG-motif cell wall-anchored protein
MQNIGVLVLRFPRTIDGNLCKHCIDKYFFRFTGVTMLLGWWGVISFFYSLIAVPTNFVSWTRSFGMRAPPEDVDSLRERRSRGSVGIAVGALFAAFALLTLALGALLASTGEDTSVVALAVMGAVIGLVAAVILFFGIRTRVRASAGLRRLGAIR